jgi:transposase
MAKDSIRLQAETLYIDECLTASEIAKRLPVSEKSIGKWVHKYKWRQRRLARQTSPEAFIKKYDDLLNTLLDKRISLETKANLTPGEKEEYNRIIDEMSKVSAIKEKLLKEGKLSLGTHVRCIERFMSFLNKHHSRLFMELIEVNKEYFAHLTDDLK